MRLACLAVALSAPAAAAGPLPTFGFVVTNLDFRVLATARGITATEYVISNPMLTDLGVPPDHAGGRLSITDDASGESGAVTLWAESVEDYKEGVARDVTAPYLGVPFGLGQVKPGRLLLGEREYTVTATDPATLRIDVRDAAVAVATPEPATAALAGLGLAAVGLRRWRN